MATVTSAALRCATLLLFPSYTRSTRPMGSCDDGYDDDDAGPRQPKEKKAAAATGASTAFLSFSTCWW